MWETIKNDPILKAVTIIILSVLGFGFAFNIMFGTRNGGMENGEGMMGGGGYSLGDTLSYIFVLAFKLLLIALVILALIALFKYASKYLFQGGESKVFNKIKNDPVLKAATVIVLSILTIGLIFVLFGNFNGTNGGYKMNYGYSYGMMGNGTTNIGFSGILTFLLEVLLFIFIAGVILGLVMYLRQNYSKEIASKLSTLKVGGKVTSECAKCGFQVPEDYKFCPACGEKTKEECPTCGAGLKPDWKCCPNCGSEKESAVDNLKIEKKKSSKSKKGIDTDENTV